MKRSRNATKRNRKGENTSNDSVINEFKEYIRDMKVKQGKNRPQEMSLLRNKKFVLKDEQDTIKSHQWFMFSHRYDLANEEFYLPCTV